MKILDKAARLEKALLDRFGRRTDISRHPIELYRAILDDIEDATEPGARGVRIFPYHAIAVSVAAADAHQRATTEAVFAEAPGLDERVRTRLRQSGCTDVDSVTVTLKITGETAYDWSGRDYHIEFRRRTTPRQLRRPDKVPPSEQHELQLSVMAGSAAKSRYGFTTPRVNLGRLADVVDRHQRIVRQNHVAFVDGDDDVSQSVSRAHAHIRFDAGTGEARLYDDGSTHGTRVARSGRTISIPGGGRGLLLRENDEVLLGQARLRVTLRKSQRR
jgi:hypothetical protein